MTAQRLIDLFQEFAPADAWEAVLPHEQQAQMVAGECRYTASGLPAPHPVMAIWPRYTPEDRAALRRAHIRLTRFWGQLCTRHARLINGLMFSEKYDHSGWSRLINLERKMVVAAYVLTELSVQVFGRRTYNAGLYEQMLQQIC